MPSIAATGTVCSGTNRVKVEPSPGFDRPRPPPPRRPPIPAPIDRPKPVPPYLAPVVPFHLDPFPNYLGLFFLFRSPFMWWGYFLFGWLAAVTSMQSRELRP